MNVSEQYEDKREEYEDIVDALEYMNNNPEYFYKFFADNIIKLYLGSKVKRRTDRFVSGLVRRLENLRIKIGKLEEASK